MTTHESGPVDIDLLADYIGDALEEPERSRVGRLVTDDPEWRSAFTLLAQGMSEVGDELGELGAEPEPMPEDLAVRLEAAFAADPVTGHEPLPAALTEPAEPHLVPSRGDRHLVSVPSGRGAKATARRRRLRWAAPIAAAAGFLAFAGVGTTYLTGRQTGAESTAAGGATDSRPAPLNAAEDAGSNAGMAPGVTDQQITATGTNYTAETLRTAPAGALSDPAPAQADERMDASKRAEAIRPQAPPVADLSAPGLARLTDRAALQACLEAIAQQHGGPIVVQSVDYARFGGAAALVVRFTAAGTTWAWATGPDCGAPGRGAQVLQTARVG